MGQKLVVGNFVFLRRFPRNNVPEDTVYRVGIVKRSFSDPGDPDRESILSVDLYERVPSGENVFRPSRFCEKIERVSSFFDVVGFVVYPTMLPHGHLAISDLPRVPIW